MKMFLSHSLDTFMLAWILSIFSALCLHHSVPAPSHSYLTDHRHAMTNCQRHPFPVNITPYTYITTNFYRSHFAEVFLCGEDRLHTRL